MPVLASIVSAEAFLAFVAGVAVISILIYRFAEESIAFVVWPTALIFLASTLTLVISLIAASQSHGRQFIACEAGGWLLAVLYGVRFGRRPPSRLRRSSESSIAVASSLGAVVPTILGILGIVDAQNFLLVMGYYLMAISLGFIAAAVAGALTVEVAR